MRISCGDKYYYFLTFESCLFYCYLILEGGKECTVEDGNFHTTDGVELRTTDADELRITVGETVILQKFNYMRTHVLNPGKNLQLGRDIVNLSGKFRNLCQRQPSRILYICFIEISVNLSLIQIKGSVVVISSDPSFLDWYVQFTTFI